MLLGLRTVEGVRLDELTVLGLSASEGSFADLLAEGFLTRTGDRVAATARGRPVLDGVLKALLT